MDTTTKARTLLDNHSRLKNKVILLDITIVTPCDGPNLENEAHVGKHFADAVERKKNKYWGWFPGTYSLAFLAMSTCGETGSDVHALIKEPVIRRVEHRSEKHSKESQQLAEGTEVAHLRQQFSCFNSRPFHFVRATISADRGWRLRGPGSSVRKARCLYTRIVSRGNQVRGTGKSERGRGRDRSRGRDRRRQRGRA